MKNYLESIKEIGPYKSLNLKRKTRNVLKNMFWWANNKCMHINGEDKTLNQNLYKFD
jgi:hypothetical protein